MAKVTSIARDRARALGLVTAVAMSAALVASPAAFGAADPVASGKLKLKLSRAFKNQLRQNGVKMKPKKFSINGGTLDPTTGTGTVNLKGKLTFKKGGKKQVYRKLTAKIGKSGNLKGKAGKVFKLRGGKVARNGFGANVTGVKVKFLKKAAKKINKKLDLSSLHQGNAGTVSANNVQPSEVTLVGGTAELVPNSATFTKFGPHCVDPTGVAVGTPGITPIAPATVTPTPTFVFPITGGELNPDGTSGTANGGGGIQIMKNINIATGAISPRCDELPISQLQQTQLVLDLTTKQIQSRNVIAGTGNPALDGDKGVAFIGTLSGGTVSSNPATRQVTINNLSAAFNATAALVLNGTFPCNGDSGFDMTTGCTGPSAFVAGDPIGTISVSAQAQ